MSDALSRDYRDQADKHEEVAKLLDAQGHTLSAIALRDAAEQMRELAEERERRLSRAPYPMISTREQMEDLLRNTDDETVILRDKGGYVWVSSCYTREGIFLTLSEGPFSSGAPFSLQAGDRLAEYGPFRVVFDTRWDADGAPDGPELVTDPHDSPSYPWNTEDKL